MKPIKRFMLTALCLLLLSVALAGSAVAKDTFVIGVEDLDYYPHYQFKGSELKGFSRDVLDRFAADKGYTFHYVAMPVKRLHRAMRDGKIDFKYPDNPEWLHQDGSQQKTYYSRPLVGSRIGVAVRPHLLGKGKIETLGVPLGFIALEYQEAQEKGNVTFKYDADFSLLMQRAIMGDLDAVYGDQAVINYHLMNNKQKLERLRDSANRIAAWKDRKLTFDESRPHSIHKFSISTLRYRNVIAEINEWVAQNRQMLQRLRKFYGLLSCPCDQ